MAIDNKKYIGFIAVLGILWFLFLNAAVLIFPGTLKIKEIGKISATNYSDVFINGNYAYCTDGAGVDILDVLNPARPKRTGHYESPGTASGVEVRYNYAFIADGRQGLQVVDVSNPANPVRVGNWNSIGTTDDYLTTVFVRGNYTYAVSNSTGLLIFDISTPSEPTLVGTFKYENPCGNDPECNGISPVDIFVNFQYAYLVDFTLGLLVVDLTDPSSPQLAAWINIPANIYEVRVSGNYAYLAAGRRGLQVVDISTPSNPVLVANYYGPENHDTTDVFISGTRAYVSYGDQLDIVNISSPLAPVCTARYSGCFAEKVFARGNYAYVANGYRVDFTVLDVSDPYSPFQVGELDKLDEPRAIALKNNYAYLSDRQNRLWVIDVTDAANPVIAGKYASPDYEYDVVVKGNYAYLTSIYPIDYVHPYGGLKVLNISNPVFPYLVGQCDTPGTPSGIFLSGNYAFIPDGEINGLAVMDISIPSAPVNIGNYVQTGTYDAAKGVFVKENYAYLAYEDNGLYILDISTPSNPKLTGNYQKDGDTVMAVSVRDNYAYLSNYYNGLLILDVTNPAKPKPVGRFEINSGCNCKALLNGNYAYILSDDAGIYAIDISNPASPSLACNYGNFDTLGWGQDLLASGNKLYAATNSGFYILEVQPAISTVSLMVQSTPDPGVSIIVTPPDVNQKGNGTTSFTRNYNTGTVVTLTAPAEYLGKHFSKWMLDGVDRVTSRNLEFTMNCSHMARACYESGELPVITLTRERFNFGVKLPMEQMVQTGAQTLMIGNSGGGTLHWSAVTSPSCWLWVEPDSGTGNAEVRVSVTVAGLSCGTYTGTITISDPQAVNSPQIVYVALIVYGSGSKNLPRGVFDTPISGSTVTGSIPVTGWALDNIGIESVKIYRKPTAGEGSGLIYIGNAVIVEGARPDIEAAFPGYPNNYKAGWGYLMLTNALPGQGNGTFILYANVVDKEGNVVNLGTKTIYCDNAHAVKPFGAIDTPAQGGTASGSKYINFGWALTPLPNTIPTNGSTITIWVDGVPLGHPVYNEKRPDVAALFPTYNNSAGAGGHFYLDTTKYPNGVHTIAWSVKDDAGNTDGIGSRYFTIQNTGAALSQESQAVFTVFNDQGSVFDVDISQIHMDYFQPVQVKKGYNRDMAPQILYPDDSGNITVEINQLERIAVYLPGAFESLSTERYGYQVIGDGLKALPIGSSFNGQEGVFSWQPGPGFIGVYELVFITRTGSGEIERKQITIKISPEFTRTGGRTE
jgi:hypothetical protein